MNTTLTALDPDAIGAEISARARGSIASLEVAAEVDSTNSELLRRAAPAAGRGVVLLAASQTAGRGRRGRVWLAAPGEVLCLSVGWTFVSSPADLSALSLVVGVCVAQALEQFGACGVSVKWPNDLVSGQRKLGGILIETMTEPAGGVYVVAGIGLNLALTPASREAIHASGTEPIDVSELVAGRAGVEPAFVAARIVEALVTAMQQFSCRGLQPYIGEWNRLDALRGQQVTLQQGAVASHGIARGIDLNGALLVEMPHGLLRFISGEVSVRAVP